MSTTTRRVLEAYRRPISVTLRTRLRGEVYSRKGQLERVFYSLNEFIVNRGISGVLSTLEVICCCTLVYAVLCCVRSYS